MLFNGSSEGIKLSSRSWLATLLACVFLVPGAYCIEVILSAEYGEDYASIESEYDVSTGVSVSEESSASFDQPAIESVRSISGTGDIDAFQSYSGSSGYLGQSALHAYGVSGTFNGAASLKPSSMRADHSGSFAGYSTDAGMSLTSQGNSVAVSSGMTSGSIVTSQNIWTGSAEGGQDTQITGADSGYIDTRGYVIGDIEWTFDRREITLGVDGKPLGDLIVYKTVSADGNVTFSIDWLPCV